MKSFEQKLEQYAELIVKIGANVQRGQSVFVNCTVDIAPLARLIAKMAYESGASNVYVDWRDDEINLLKYAMADEDVFQSYPEWEAAKRNDFVDRRAAFIFVDTPNPDLLKDVDVKRVSAYQKAAGKALAKFRHGMMNDLFSWTSVAVPSPAWAKLVFPDVQDEQDAIAKLWEAIFAAVRIDQPDPVQAWEAHTAFLQARIDMLNEMRVRKLHYRATGTDLTVELADRHVWMGGFGLNEQGIPFMANMPTEEVFTAPRKEGVNGYVTSTKPLSYGGTVIENFKLTFANGRIVEATAERGEATLKELIETDEGSHYLGELALVPHGSPISQSNLLFYNTLFDENASNHLAIGAAIPLNVEGGKGLENDELLKLGVNVSQTHVDFMIGSAEMDIDGELPDGTVVPIFRQGNWAI